MYPKIEINLNHIIENTKKVAEMCKEKNVTLAVVTKVFADYKPIVEALVENGVKCICESRIQNLKSYQSLKVEKWLIREPALCEIAEVVAYSDLSLNSEKITIQALNEEAKKQNKIHNIVLMYELGDLREGADKEELRELIKESVTLSHIKVKGIGVNLSCYGAIMPSNENMQELKELVEEMEKEFNITFDIISGGNSTSYEMIKQGKIPKIINHFRMGEAVLLGNIPCIEKPISELHQDNFILSTQIVEVKEKPSVPRGICGEVDSFGKAPKFEDKGIRKRALVNIGKQDISLNSIKPLDTNITVLGGSSDYAILDVTDSNQNYQVGDIVKFELNYSGVLGAMSSKYVEKEIRKD